jgi:hypothetical protein
VKALRDELDRAELSDPCANERGFAVLTGRWRALHHITTSPSKIGDIVESALVLTHFGHGRLTWKSVRSRHPTRPRPPRPNLNQPTFRGAATNPAR